LVKLKPVSYALAMDVVPLLKRWGESEEAKAFFERAYAPAKANVTAFPDDAESLNSLAWLCARCDERLTEAEALARRAVELAPDNVAYLDTAAEVQFRLGRADEAVRLETRAVQLDPQDSMLKEQLERFRGGK
jgi:tetratricopeptide (TPR) repeat protein